MISLSIKRMKSCAQKTSFKKTFSRKELIWRRTNCQASKSFLMDDHHKWIVFFRLPIEFFGNLIFEQHFGNIWRHQDKIEWFKIWQWLVVMTKLTSDKQTKYAESKRRQIKARIVHHMAYMSFEAQSSRYRTSRRNARQQLIASHDRIFEHAIVRHIVSNNPPMKINKYFHRLDTFFRFPQN